MNMLIKVKPTMKVTFIKAGKGECVGIAEETPTSLLLSTDVCEDGEPVIFAETESEKGYRRICGLSICGAKVSIADFANTLYAIAIEKGKLS